MNAPRGGIERREGECVSGRGAGRGASGDRAHGDTVKNNCKSGNGTTSRTDGLRIYRAGPERRRDARGGAANGRRRRTHRRDDRRGDRRHRTVHCGRWQGRGEAGAEDQRAEGERESSHATPQTAGGRNDVHESNMPLPGEGRNTGEVPGDLSHVRAKLVNAVAWPPWI
ncbi:hypothetical protein GCM10010532_023750 [Dactylosporangium siamense]|uniref:Uncharacterized protein n=1 Tax=Dactylosporangium siamense TaxID=685454 RepID=A0A919PGL6_9ACTN|nr:hypothetical protein Dsi01nite_016150 [Dactylosporangium siamense]